MPKRLLQIAKDGSNWRLRIESDVATDAGYCTLSYCWGTAIQGVTTIKNLKPRQDNLSFDEMPRTIRDAITVTHKLDIKYLWYYSLGSSRFVY